jgi:hypothetical protein
MHPNDRAGHHHPGAPAGKYLVSYVEQSDAKAAPIALKKRFLVVEESDNSWTVELNDKQ